jgi:hypothetical protein
MLRRATAIGGRFAELAIPFALIFVVLGAISEYCDAVTLALRRPHRHRGHAGVVTLDEISG